MKARSGYPCHLPLATHRRRRHYDHLYANNEPGKLSKLSHLILTWKCGAMPPTHCHCHSHSRSPLARIQVSCCRLQLPLPQHKSKQYIPIHIRMLYVNDKYCIGFSFAFCFPRVCLFSFHLRFFCFVGFRGQSFYFVFSIYIFLFF